jgi:hypothetical protein
MTELAEAGPSTEPASGEVAVATASAAAGDSWLRWAAGVLVVIQIIAVVVFGAITIQRDPLWAPIDEGPHFDNVIFVAAHGSYPVLDKVLASDQQLAILQGRYPRHTTIVAIKDGLVGLAYEAFQPPLYYFVAAPVSLLSGNYHTKAILLRYFGLLLVVVSIALLARLSRHVLGRRWLLGLAGGLLILLMPGFLVRMVTISNLALAVPLAILTVTELWIAWKRQSWRRLPLCGLLVGACVLTDLYLVELAALYALVAADIFRRERSRAPLLAAGSGGVVAGLVIAPWIIFNLVKFHTLTATALAKRMQLPTVNPTHVHFSVGQLPNLTLNSLFQPLMPEEWAGRIITHPLYSYFGTIFNLMAVLLAIVLAVALGRRMLTSGLWILVVPFVCNVVLCWYVDVGQQWESGSMVGRYLYPTLVPLALFSVAAVVLLASNYWPLLATLALSSVFLVVLWVHLVPTIHTTT